MADLDEPTVSVLPSLVSKDTIGTMTPVAESEDGSYTSIDPKEVRKETSVAFVMEGMVLVLSRDDSTEVRKPAFFCHITFHS